MLTINLIIPNMKKQIFPFMYHVSYICYILYKYNENSQFHHRDIRAELQSLFLCFMLDIGHKNMRMERRRKTAWYQSS